MAIHSAYEICRTVYKIRNTVSYLRMENTTLSYSCRGVDTLGNKQQKKIANVYTHCSLI